MQSVRPISQLLKYSLFPIQIHSYSSSNSLYCSMEPLP